MVIFRDVRTFLMHESILMKVKVRSSINLWIMFLKQQIRKIKNCYKDNGMNRIPRDG